MRASICLRLSVGMCLLALASVTTAQNAMTSDSADVYAGPDGSYPEVAQLDPDTPIQVMGCLNDWSWCDVAFEGNRGWLYSPDITYQYQGGYVPLYSYAPGLGVPVVAFSFDAYWGSYYHDRPFYQQRDQWAHRTIHHQRPSGPPPSSSPPPRQAIRDVRPHEGAQPDHGVRLGSAEASRQQAERQNGSAAHVETPAAEPRHQDRPPPAGQRPEVNAKPPGTAAPQREDPHSHPAARVEPQHTEPQHHAEPPHPAPEKREDPPKD
jgi:uncharacterized protein YraI